MLPITIFTLLKAVLSMCGYIHIVAAEQALTKLPTVQAAQGRIRIKREE
jgi:hypothetical protein